MWLVLFVSAAGIAAQILTAPNAGVVPNFTIADLLVASFYCAFIWLALSTKHHTGQLFRRRAAQSLVSFNRLLSPLVLYVAYLATTFSFHVFLTLISVAESWTIGAVSLMWMYRSPVQRYNLNLNDITLS